MSQELSDANPISRLSNADLAEWCRARADESGDEHPIARLTFRSIADRLERPAVDGTLLSRWYKDDDDRDFVLWSVVGIENDMDLTTALGCDPKDNMPVNVTLTPAKTLP